MSILSFINAMDDLNVPINILKRDKSNEGESLK